MSSKSSLAAYGVFASRKSGQPESLKVEGQLPVVPDGPEVCGVADQRVQDETLVGQVLPDLAPRPIRAFRRSITARDSINSA